MAKKLFDDEHNELTMALEHVENDLIKEHRLSKQLQRKEISIKKTTISHKKRWRTNKPVFQIKAPRTRHPLWIRATSAG